MFQRRCKYAIAVWILLVFSGVIDYLFCVAKVWKISKVYILLVGEFDFCLYFVFFLNFLVFLLFLFFYYSRRLMSMV